MRFAFLVFAPALMAQFTPDQLREDLLLARRALEEGHPGVYRYTPKAEFARGFDAAAARLTGPMTALEFYRVLAPAAALVKCGHTGLSLPPELQKELAAQPVLPFDVDILDGRVYVLRDLTPAAGLAGAEVISINGVPAGRLLAQLEAATSGDGNIAVGRWGRLARGGFVRGLASHAGLRSPYLVTTKLNGVRSTAEFAGLSAAERPASPAPTGPIASLEFPEGTKTAVLTIRSFGGFADRARKQPLGKFLTDAFGQIRDRGAESLILDLRGNGGGRDELGKQLFAHLSDREFAYYSALILNARSFTFDQYLDRPLQVGGDEIKARADGRFDVHHPNIGPQKPAKPAFRGRVIALADRDSFSATGEFLTAFHSARRGTIVGEETGAASLGNTSGMGVTVVLPHTKLRLILPLNGYYLPSSRPVIADRGIMPDVPVTPTIEDKIAGRDPAMARARQLATAR